MGGLICPYCRSGGLRLYGRFILYCSSCGSIYRRSSSDVLEKLNVEPVSDRSSYPEVMLYSTFPYCDCSVRAYIERGGSNGGIFGSRYCPKHNVITLEGFWRHEELGAIAEEAVEIINHETLHWILCRDFDESASMSLDNEAVSAFILAEKKPEHKEITTLEELFDLLQRKSV